MIFLLQAISNGDHDEIRRLLNQKDGVPIEIIFAELKCFKINLFQAISNGDHCEIRRLLNQKDGVPIEIIIAELKCFKLNLFQAISNGDHDEIRRLLNQKDGVPMEIRNSHGLTPLQVVCAKKDSEMVEALLRLGFIKELHWFNMEQIRRLNFILIKIKIFIEC